MQDNPFADLIPGAPQQQAPGVIYGRPKQPDPVEQARLQISQNADSRAQQTSQLNNELRQVQIEKARRELAGGDTGGDVSKDTIRRNGLDALSAQIDRVQELYQQNFANQGIATPLEYLPGLPANEQFASAGAGLADQALAAFRVPGVGAQSDRELAAFVAANQPKPGDTDAAIEEKLSNLRRRVDSQRAAFGQEPWNWGGSNAPAPLTPRGEGTRTVMAENAPESPFNEQQLAAFDAVISSGGTDEQIINLARSYGQTVNPEDVRAYLDYRNSGGTAAPQFIQDETLTPEQQAEVDRRLQGSDAAGSFAVGAADTVTLGTADELGAGLDAAFGAGNGTFRERYNNELAINRGIQSQLSERDPGSYLTGQIAGGFVLPAAGARTPAQLARLGAAYGGAYGAGSANGGIGDRIAGGAAGAAVGGATGYGLARLGQAAAARFGGSGGPGGGSGGARADSRALMEAARRQGIDILPADVGGPMTRRFTAGTAQTPFGSGPIINAANRSQEQAGSRLSQIAATEGAPVRQEALGELAQNAAQGYIDRTGAVARRGYDRAREMAGSTPLRGERAVASIDSQLAELSQTANTDAPLINGLERLRADLANEAGARDLTIDAIRRLRTSTRAEALSEGLRGTDYQRRSAQVLDALSEDIASQLPAEAAAAFRQQDKAYAERLNTIDDVIQNVIGRRGDRAPEAVANRLISMTRGDSARLRSFLNAVKPEEAGIIRGSLIQAMGRATRGQQDSTGEAFSLQTFLSNWADMPERTKGLLFRGDNRKAIEDLALVASGARDSARFANSSNTAGASNVTETGRAISYGAGLSSLGATFVLENLTGRLLASQRFGQWLARAPKDPAKQGQWVKRLSQIASREPAIANDIIPLQQALQQTVQRSAAQEAPENQPN